MTKILIIDDEVAFTDLMRMNLEKTGNFDVRVENQSNLALRAAREFDPDVILLDIVMPGMDGGDLSARFKEHPKLKDTPVIIISALVANNETADDAVAMSGDQIIVAKPVRMEKLRKSIDFALASQTGSPGE
jgi:DNA-binding response OmpR family regulator